MKISLRSYLLVVSVLLCVHGAFAQLMEVTNDAPFNAENLVSNIFLGNGVEVVNIEYIGSDGSVGFFKNGQNAVGLERGIVMTTGNAVSSGSDIGVDGIGSQLASVNSLSTFTDTDLNTIAGGVGVNNLTKYIITFIPISDTLQFRYVFGSEEYPEYVCSQYNDVFGFFISGPGISGPYENNAENIAKIPGTNLPVTINNVNPGVVGANGTGENCSPPNGSLAYSSLYVNNDNSLNNPVYDGMTTVFTAEAIVQPCQEYTIKLVICDVGDNAWDSGVFLEAKSFGTGSVDIEVSTVSLDGTVTEGCTEGAVSFSVPSPVSEDYQIDYQILGEAENGVDYVEIPLDLVIPAGDSSLVIPIVALEDGLDEGIESIIFDIQKNICKRDTVYVHIRDNEIIPPELGDDITSCRGDSVQLDGTVPVEVPPPPTFSSTDPLVIQPTNSAIFSDVFVFGVLPPTLGPGVIQSICIDSLSHRWIDDLDIYLISPGGQFIELTTDNGGDGGNGLGMDFYLNTCFTEDALVPINYNPLGGNNQAPPDAVPFTGNWLPEGVWSDLWDSENPTNGTWSLQLIDDTNGLVGTLHNWSITFNPVYEVSYKWEPAIGLTCADCPNPLANPIATTTYTLTATDSYGCEVIDQITVEVQDKLPSPTVFCNEVLENVISIGWEAVDGATDYEISVDGGDWEPANGNLLHTVNNIPLSTTVSFEVRAIGSCAGEIGSIQCTTPACISPQLNISVLTDVSCNGGSDGSVVFDISGGTSPFVFALNEESNNTGVFAGLSANDYEIEVLDSNLCGTSLAFSIKEPEAMTSQKQVLNQVSCFGGTNGSATLEVTGGQTPYNFEWGDLQTDSIAQSLSAGIHIVRVTDTGGCILYDTIEIEEPPLLELEMNAISVSCPGSEDGNAIVNPTGGTGPYTIQWDSNAEMQTRDTAYFLKGGEYFVEVIDFKGCTADGSVIVEENEDLFLMTSLTDATCNGVFDGTATVHALGGSGVFTYLWNDPLQQTDSLATGLTVGDYNVEVSDSNGCTDTVFVSISAPNPIGIDVQTVSPSCFGSNDGQVQLSVNGGTPIYSYNWHDIGVGDGLRNDLSEGDYTVTISDINSCFEEVSFSIISPDPIEISLETSEMSCFGGNDANATAFPSGGTGDYNFQWDDSALQQTPSAQGLMAGIYSVTVSDENNCEAYGNIEILPAQEIQVQVDITSPLCNSDNSGAAIISSSGGAGQYSYLWELGSADSIRNDLATGTYLLTITDAKGCEVIESFTLSEPEPLSMAFDITPSGCNGLQGGSITAMPIGGTSPYTYKWGTGEETPLIENLSSGNYEITLTDSNDCLLFDTVTVLEPDEIIAEINGHNINCAGGTDGGIEVSATGGAGNFTYNWNMASLPDSPSLTDLSAGNYEVTVSDENDCEVTLSINLSGPDSLQMTTAAFSPSCFEASDGSIDLTIGGGIAPYEVIWDNQIQEEDLLNISAGIFTATVTDANNCIESLEVTLSDPEPLVISNVSSPISCYGGNNGALDISVNGGAGNYAYVWDGPDGFSSQQRNLTDLIAGNYSLTVTDGSNCTQSALIEILQPTEEVLTSIPEPEKICFGTENGQVSVSVSGGTAPYTYLWSSGQESAIASNLAAGMHFVTISDAEDCTYFDTVMLVQLEVLSAQLIQTPPLCNDGLDGTASIQDIWYGNSSSNIDDFTFQWDDNTSQTSSNATGLKGGESYSVTITDDLGCTTIENITLDNPESLLLQMDSKNDVSCFNGADGQISVSGTGGTSSYEYHWSVSAGSQTTSTAVDLPAGTFKVTLTDANLCPTVLSVTLNEPPSLETSFAVSNVECFGDPTGSVDLDVKGGISPYSYVWSNGVETSKVTDVVSGNYSVSIYDSNACLLVDSIVVSQPSSPITSQFEITDVTCFGATDGKIQIETFGGTPNYEYSLDGNKFFDHNSLLSLAEGFYEIILKDENDCLLVSEPQYVGQPEPLLLEMGGDTVINYGEEIQLYSSVQNAFGDIRYVWSPGDSTLIDCTNCPNPLVKPETITSFWLTITDENGCQIRDQITVHVQKQHFVTVPTGFTPNDDGKNDLLHVHGKEGTKILSFQVFDRWGEMLYQEMDFDVNSTSIGWDGKFKSTPMNPGVFVWYLQVEYIDGSKENLKGQTTLIR